MTWGTKKEIETRRRIKLLLWAYAYECCAVSIVSDTTFDDIAREVDLSIATDRPDLDEWFKENFDECTGSWVHDFPEKDKIKWILEKYYNIRSIR